MPDYLTPGELVERLHGAVSASTLKNWRLADPPQGPGFLRVTGGRRGHVLYPLDEVERFESQHFRGGRRGRARRRGR